MQPVGPTDLVQLMMVEYASSYGNDWFVVPLTVGVGSVTRIDSLVVTDTFGVRTLLRPIGDRALPPPYFSMWQPSNLRRSGDVNEEVPREGLHLTRRRTLARWTDGSTWLWTSFQADVGVGEGSSGLRFDGLIEKTAEG